MQEILFEYKLNPTTWAYLSALITVAVYFMFRRFWSVRNLDLIALIAFSPGLLLLYHGLTRDMVDLQEFGHIWLFGVSAFFLIRLLLDAIMVRRPLLEPNLSAGGLAFTCVALLVFLIANIIANHPQRPIGPNDLAAPSSDQDGRPVRSPRLEDALPRPEATGQIGPGYPPFYYLAGYEATPGGSDRRPAPEADAAGPDRDNANRDNASGAETPEPEAYRRAMVREATQKTIAVFAHLAVVVGLVLIGYRHFDNFHTGVAVASLYLLTLYTSQMVGRIDHVLPAALLVWAVQFYRRPAVAGLLVGLAGGVIYFPLYLLPLWCSFYWRRGLIRFAIGVVAAFLLLVLLLAFSPEGLGSFASQLRQTFGWMNPLEAKLVGFWEYHEAQKVFRIPVLAAFVALCGSLALWPAQKNLGTLLSCSAAVMVGTQFWQAQYGGLYMGWYLPLVLLTIFRPNLEDRVAQSAVGEAHLWLLRRRVLRGA